MSDPTFDGIPAASPGASVVDSTVRPRATQEPGRPTGRAVLLIKACARAAALYDVLALATARAGRPLEARRYRVRAERFKALEREARGSVTVGRSQVAHRETVGHP